jgi:hypothetical protein
VRRCALIPSAPPSSWSAWPTSPPARASAHPGRSRWGCCGRSTPSSASTCTAHHLAEEACEIEITRSSAAPVGKQDQYIAAFGGLSVPRIRHRWAGHRLAACGFRHRPCMTWRSASCSSSRATRVTLTSQLQQHATGAPLATRRCWGAWTPWPPSGSRCARPLRRGHAWLRGSPPRALAGQAPALDWDEQRGDRWLVRGGDGQRGPGREAGRCGRWGFLLFYAEDTQSLRAAMAREGLDEVHFSFDLDGSTVIVRD